VDIQKLVWVRRAIRADVLQFLKTTLRGKIMTSSKPARICALLGSIAILTSLSLGATIQGTVKGPDNAAFQDAFVEAQNSKTKITTIVVSDGQGHYRIEKLPAGDYRLLIHAVGYKAEPRSGIALTADQTSSFDFALQNGTVRWSDISVSQAKQLLPDAKGKTIFFSNCSVCHSFQTRLAAVSRDEEGYRDRIRYMQQAMHFSFTFSNPDRFNDDMGDQLAAWLAASFGPDATLPKSPAALPGYKDTLIKFGADATNIVFVEYDMPGPSRMPFSAAPARDGSLWIPNFGSNNKITRLDPTTGEMEDFSVPTQGTAAIHSAVPAPDGSVWMCQQGSNEIGRWDPNTKKITEYQDPYLPGKERTESGGEKHTCRVDPGGNVWATGSPLTRFDPETRKFTHFFDVPQQAYGLEPDAEGNMWFTKQTTNQIGKVDWKTLKVTYYTPPNSKKLEHPYPRRLAIDSNGIVWVGEYTAGQIDRFDPKTETFKEYMLPGFSPSPYAMGIDSQNNVWYSSFDQDVLGRLDQKTDKITLFPFPHPENTIREFFRDPQGRMWYGTPSNNKVGYFYLTGEAINQAKN
jgi:virginiamycin B lyase